MPDADLAIDHRRTHRSSQRGRGARAARLQGELDTILLGRVCKEPIGYRPP